MGLLDSEIGAMSGAQGGGVQAGGLGGLGQVAGLLSRLSAR